MVAIDMEISSLATPFEDGPANLPSGPANLTLCARYISVVQERVSVPV
jgi:hypothetical protein